MFEYYRFLIYICIRVGLITKRQPFKNRRPHSVKVISEAKTYYILQIGLRILEVCCTTQCIAIFVLSFAISWLDAIYNCIYWIPCWYWLSPLWRMCLIVSLSTFSFNNVGQTSQVLLNTYNIEADVCSRQSGYKRATCNLLPLARPPSTRGSLSLSFWQISAMPWIYRSNNLLQ